MTEEQRPVSPVSICVSIKSDRSKEFPPEFSSDAVPSVPKIENQRAVSSVSSCVSMNSDRSKEFPPEFSSDAVPFSGDSLPCVSKTEGQRPVSPVSSWVSMKSDQSKEFPPEFSSDAVPSVPNVQEKTRNSYRKKLDLIFKELEEKAISLLKNKLNAFKKLLSHEHPASNERDVEDDNDQSGREGALKLTLHILRNMNHTDLANTLECKLAPACHQKIKLKLRQKCQRINEGVSGHGNSVLLNEIYTELYVTEEDSQSLAMNKDHEVKQIETASWKSSTWEKPIKCSDIFKALPEQKKPIRTVLTKGVAGIGKTVSVQKFILDWAEGKANQDVLFILPLPFRELNLMKEKKLSLMNLLHCLLPETQGVKSRHYRCYKVMFILDGLDECRLSLDFQNNENLEDINEQTSLDVLLTNLIKGNLLPSALLWITSRPAAVSQIPPEYVDQVTEVRGFWDSQKQEYFKKKISDENLANKVFTHVRSSRSLYIMCHIPVFCWIVATVLEKMLTETKNGEIPSTLTQMFTHFLVFQIKHMNQKYIGKSGIDLCQTRKHILALGKLAFQQLEKGNLIFYEEDLRDCGIDLRDVSVYSGVFTQIFKEEYGLQLGKVFSFVHLSVQEFLAALYAFLKRKVLNQTTELNSNSTMTDFLNGAVDTALQSKSGHLDLFLRFLLGLSLESNQILLQGIVTQADRSSHSSEETVKYIKEKIQVNNSPEKSINLFHCLNELNDQSLVQEVQTYLSQNGKRRLHQTGLSSAQWSALVFVLLNSKEELDEFDLSKYDPSEECLLSLLPVAKASRRAMLSSCNLGGKAGEYLGSVLLENSFLKDLDLSDNDLQDSGVKLLSGGLKSSHCKLQILRLSGCMITEDGCSSLASALSSNPSHLKELDLTYNHPGETGIKLLSARLEDPNCTLKELRMEHAGIIRIQQGLKKYMCGLTLDPNTAHPHLCLGEGNRKVVCVLEQHPYPDHPERFDGLWQVMSRESLIGRCYWEAEWSGRSAAIALTYKTIGRKEEDGDCDFGWNEKSWSLICSGNSCCVYHNRTRTDVLPPLSRCRRVGVYVDCPAGTLSFYSVSAEKLTHLHTFNTSFSEPLYAGFWLQFNSCVRIIE